MVAGYGSSRAIANISNCENAPSQRMHALEERQRQQTKIDDQSACSTPANTMFMVSRKGLSTKSLFCLRSRLSDFTVRACVYVCVLVFAGTLQYLLFSFVRSYQCVGNIIFNGGPWVAIKNWFGHKSSHLINGLSLFVWVHQKHWSVRGSGW